MGILLTHQWDVAGEDDFDTSITGGQYFYNFNLGKGRQIAAGPTFSYNHEARVTTSGPYRWVSAFPRPLSRGAALEIRRAVLALCGKSGHLRAGLPGQVRHFTGS